VVVLTGQPDYDDCVEAMKLGAFHYLRKPMEPALIEETLWRAVEHGGLRRENAALRRMLAPATMSDFVGDSPAIRAALELAQKAAVSDSKVVILGESGTGKGVVARRIHEQGRRRQKAFLDVHCGAVAHELLESELFGHERGAYTDARTTQVGRVELAHRGTLFLDEVGELPFDAQAKLLRVLQEAEFERLGSHRTMHVETRVIAATNRDIREEVRAGRFRRDLYFRLNVFPITVPPLRQRRSDIPLLARRLVERLAARNGKRIVHIPRTVLEQLEQYAWPGNVRELENVLERAVITSTDGTLRLADPLESQDPLFPDGICGETLQDVERAHILRILAATCWRIEGQQGAARTLGLKPSTLRSRMQKLHIHRTYAASAPSSRSIIPVSA
jgi:DNA-binding NtrC family response regulator